MDIVERWSLAYYVIDDSNKTELTDSKTDSKTELTDSKKKEYFALGSYVLVLRAVSLWTKFAEVLKLLFLLLFLNIF